MTSAKIFAGLGAAAATLAVNFIARRNAPVKKPVVDPDFNELFNELLTKFLAYIKKDFDLSPQHMERLKYLFQYNCIGGKMYRATLCTSAVRTLCKYKGLDYSKYVQRGMVLGVCVEVLQACFLVADDIMDASQTRRGQPCWYLLPTIKLDAVNDTLILESFIYYLLAEYFAADPATHLQLSELFRTVSLQTQIGQMLDLTSQPQGRKGPEVLKGFNLDLYKKIVKYKTACYTFWLPMASGLALCGFNKESELETARNICMELGEKFQIEDDYLDCYQDPEILGKIGTDIHDHKCSWLCIQALLRMTPAQRAVFESNYGKDSKESEAVIKQLYRELNLEAVYFAQEDESKKRIQAMIASVKTLPDLFTHILDKIHNRQK